MDKEYKKYIIPSIIIFLIILSFIYTITNKNSNYEILAEAVDANKILSGSNKDIVEKEETQETQELDKTEEVKVINETLSLNINNSTIQSQKIPVYVCGQVCYPDVYYLDEGSIIKDAITIAGGFTSEANKSVWNLAMEIQRGLKIEVPKVGEEIDKIAISYDNSIKGSDTQNFHTTEPVVSTQRLININRATASELTSLPGIGPAIAQNIIQYRENNGAFRSLQDIDNVPRIGQVTLEKIKDYICFE